MRTGTQPFKSLYVAALNGERYLVLQPSKNGVPGPRSWSAIAKSDQTAPPDDFEVKLDSFHDGCGYSFGSAPNVCDQSFGWDTSVPGKITTWSAIAAAGYVDMGGSINAGGAQVVPVSQKAYLFGGRYVYRYSAVASGFTMDTGTFIKDFGAGNDPVGRAVIWNNRIYVPMGAAVRWQEYNIATDTWTQGPAAGCFAQFFTIHKDLLVRGVAGANQIATCATTPTTAANWSDFGTTGYLVGSTGSIAYDAKEWNRYLFVKTDTGLYSFTTDLYTASELPSIGPVADPYPFARMGVLGDDVFLPHSSGLFRIKPGRSWRRIGPTQERQTEGAFSTNWGVPYETVGYGERAYVAWVDRLVALEPGLGGRGPYVPHLITVNTGSPGDTPYYGVAVVPGLGTPTDYLCAAQFRASDSKMQLAAWPVSSYGYSPGNDASLYLGTDYTHPTAVAATLRTPRVYQPGMGLAKTWRVFEFWLEVNSSNVAGFQVWASVNEGAYYQLADASGAAATFTTGGFKQAFFPADATAAGNYVALELRVAAKSGGQVAMAATVRSGVLRGLYNPIRGTDLTLSFILGDGEFEDGESMNREPEQQLADLLAIWGQRVSYRDPAGNSGYAAVRSVKYQEQDVPGFEQPTFVAAVTLGIERYS